jgi:hypothetical protein
LFLVGRRSVRQGSNEERSKCIVAWNFISCVALTNMHKMDLMLGSVVVGLLLAVMITGIVGIIV